MSRASGKPQDTLSLERLGHFLCIASFMVPLSGCNLVALHLSPGCEESKAQTGYPTCRSCPPSLEPSRAHAQHSRACGMNACVHIHLIGHFSDLWLIVGAFSPNPLPFSASNNQTTFFFGFSGSECHCPHQARFSPWSQAQAKQLLTSPGHPGITHH